MGKRTRRDYAQARAIKMHQEKLNRPDYQEGDTYRPFEDYHWALSNPPGSTSHICYREPGYRNTSHKMLCGITLNHGTFTLYSIPLSIMKADKVCPECKAKWLLSP